MTSGPVRELLDLTKILAGEWRIVWDFGSFEDRRRRMEVCSLPSQPWSDSLEAICLHSDGRRARQKTFSPCLGNPVEASTMGHGHGSLQGSGFRANLNFSLDGVTGPLFVTP
ncbi:hypothetical protein V6N11_067382 [Hibiscus sabdariffa]|uniref:Plastid lipid-associated protein/fibrillin conserved domain-containing protein n=1 Tax=Hibiscus sabdariffa TaxID=183260 RepID=A0ABR2SQK8_9ROSI